MGSIPVGGATKRSAIIFADRFFQKIISRLLYVLEVDIVCYFYRSTDRYCNIKPDELIVEWEEDAQSYYFGISFDFSKHSGIIVKGRFPEKYISQEKEHLYSIPLKKLQQIFLHI